MPEMQHFLAQVGVFVLFCFAVVLFTGIAAGFLFSSATKAAERPTVRPHEPTEPGVPA